MDIFALKPEDERRALIQEAASRRGLVEIIVEKDFWVCWTLKRLFSNSMLSSVLTFKGGTSLSKGYGLIERFSEDIDLTISRDAQFLCDSPDPMEHGISKNERGRRIDALKENAQRFVAEIILPTLTSDLETALTSKDGWSVTLDGEDPDQQTILFYYPKVFNYVRGNNFSNFTFDHSNFSISEYIRPHIKLEFGARGDVEPKDTCAITSIVAEEFARLFTDPTIQVSTLHVDRTFWEKATILHSIYHGSKLRDRMSRHYYDTYVLAQKGKAEQAIENPELLQQVVRNKSVMFRDAKASYDTALIGSLKLLPKDDQLPGLKDDYTKMADMFMGDVPDFDVILAELKKLQEKINQSPTK